MHSLPMSTNPAALYGKQCEVHPSMSAATQ